MVNNVATFEKAENIEYNADGHIVTYGDNTCVYDGLGRLIRENNKALDKTFLFEYNVGGNIVSKTEHAYTTGIVGAATATYNYTYGNAWKDQLTSFGGQSIVYDASGNPTSYLGAALTWSKGRLLTRYVNGDDTVTMQYDANGIRRIKTSPGGLGITKTTEYVYDSEGRLRAERIGNMDRYYIYSSNGIEGYEEGGVTYTYRKNLFGDITAIYKGTTKMAEYVYDAWGNCTITLDKRSCGTGNPFRYRGYYFDNDLQMYYLMTRYYDPVIGRFINADSIEYLEPNTINGLNLYAYCYNNPIMFIDPTGTDISYECNLDEGYDPEDELMKSGGGGGGGNAGNAASGSYSGSASGGYTSASSYTGGNAVYRGGSYNTRDIDVRYNKSTGKVTTKRGISINTNPSEAAKHGTVSRVDQIPYGLSIIPYGSPGHYEIVPGYSMSKDEYQSLLWAIKYTILR
ncbi:MAG: RHS repeat-associated core domain-containing protein [Clostridia bacterium]|nr:RHS repeat-associated core domain-containing protein [Clostridia bacterium]